MLALLSDAGHAFMDLFALFISLGAIKLAAQPVNVYHRAKTAL
jgi:cobalt-zinc-cadmium efflux system protein